MARTGYARGTLAPRDGMQAEIPPMGEPPLLTMSDMGMSMDHGSMAGMDMSNMSGMDHSAKSGGSEHSLVGQAPSSMPGVEDGSAACGEKVDRYEEVTGVAV